MAHIPKNEIVRLRQQIRTLEERKTGDSESEAEEEVEEEVENEVENVALHYAEGELARVKTELEEQGKKNTDLDSKNVDLQSKNDDLEIDYPLSTTYMLETISLSTQEKGTLYKGAGSIPRWFSDC